MRTPICLVLGVAVVACGYSPVRYDPQPITRDAAIKSIERCLREQPRDLAPVEVEVNSEFARVITNPIEKSLVRKSMVSYDRAETVYYESIDKAIIEARGKMLAAQLLDRSGAVVLRCYSTDKARAERFVDGVMSLRDQQH